MKTSALFAAVLLVVAPSLARADDESFKRKMDEVDRAGARYRLTVVQALATSMVAGDVCPGLSLNRGYAYRLTQQTLRPPLSEEIAEIRAKFDADKPRACELALALYGPAGQTMPGLVLTPPAGDFLEEWHGGAAKN